MTRIVSDIDVLSTYLKGVMKRADHHAQNVGAVALTLAGAIVWRKDPVPLEVREQDGELKNVLWVVISQKRYAFSYNHAMGTIDIRERTTGGTTLARFSNATSTQYVRDFFASL
jgi:hypothetical protein